MTTMTPAALRALLQATEAAAGSKPAGASSASAASAAASAVAVDPQTAKAVSKAVAFGLRSTQQRPQTVVEITDKLRGRYEDNDVVVAAVAQLQAVGALDDAAFARAWVEDRGRRRGYGVMRLRQELRRRQVDDDVVDQALTALEDRDEFTAAVDLAKRRVVSLPAKLEPEAVARRLHAYLVRRGYNHGLANKVAISVSGLDRHRNWD